MDGGVLQLGNIGQGLGLCAEGKGVENHEFDFRHVQCSCLDNARDEGAQWAAVYGGRTESDKTEVTQQTFQGTLRHLRKDI